LIPLSRDFERTSLKLWLKGRKVVVIFDGTTLVSETVAIVVGVVINHKLCLRLVALPMLAESLSGEETCGLLLQTLVGLYGVALQNIMVAAHDRASTNYKAITALKLVARHVISVGCLSHTCDHVGEHFTAPLLDEFFMHFQAIFSNSIKARNVFRDITGQALKRPNNTRFWSHFETRAQIFKLWAHISAVLERLVAQKISSTTAPRALALLVAEPNMIYVQLASFIDAMEPFVKATYTLEGDESNLPFDTYAILNNLSQHIAVFRAGTHPNLSSVVASLAMQESVADLFVKVGRVCAEGAFNWYEEKYDEPDLKAQVDMFKSARLCDPRQHRLLTAHSSDTVAMKIYISALKSVPGITEFDIENLLSEVGKYLATCRSDPISENYRGLKPAVALQMWFHKHQADIPAWSHAFDQCLLIMPSSCAAERVFSLLKATFGEKYFYICIEFLYMYYVYRYNMY
jgi:hypothetical protein